MDLARFVIFEPIPMLFMAVAAAFARRREPDLGHCEVRPLAEQHSARRITCPGICLRGGAAKRGPTRGLRFGGVRDRDPIFFWRLSGAAREGTTPHVCCGAVNVC